MDCVYSEKCLVTRRGTCCYTAWTDENYSGCFKIAEGYSILGRSRCFYLCLIAQTGYKTERAPIKTVPSRCGVKLVSWCYTVSSLRMNGHMNGNMAANSYTVLCLMLHRTWHYKFQNPCINEAVSRTAEGTDIHYIWLPQFLTISRTDFDVFHADKYNRTLAPDYWSCQTVAFIQNQPQYLNQ